MPSTLAASPVVRRTQAERKATSRAALLDAAVDTLTELGSSGFTTTEVCRRAELSQGALFKHFATKADLLAATTEHLFDELRDQYTAAFHDPAGGPLDLADAISLLWGAMSDPRLHAAFDLYTDARTDATLRASLQPVVTAHLDHIHRLGDDLATELGVQVDDTTRAIVELAILSMQGLMLNNMAAPDPGARERLDATLRLVAPLLMGASS